MVENNRTPRGDFRHMRVFVSLRPTTTNMHHQRSLKAQRALRFGAWHFIFNLLVAVAAMVCVVYGLYLHDQFVVYYGVGLLVFWVVSLIFFFIKGAGQRCSLCMNPIWAGRKCQKHSKVKPALGVSYRLGTAVSIICRGHYRCPYCGEPFHVEHGQVRSRKKTTSLY